MAGFYIHIPFCKKVCYYCDFHFVATLKHKDEMMQALQLEIEERADEWKETKFSTLYIGGGTPSVLQISEIEALISKAKQHYNFEDNIELTLEANPDDLTVEYLTELKKNTPINRFSIGTQSFHDRDLVLMNRRHNGIEALTSIRNAHNLGFNNLNIDLIYGVPGLSIKEWEYNIDKFIELQIPHLSAYHLTFEPKTVFDHMRKKNKITPVDEDISQQHYQLLIKKMKQAGYVHYEVSNFAKEGHYSKHNTNYWLGNGYLGIGPSAHSFKGNSRRWNVANNTQYCKQLSEGGNNYFTVEESDIPTAFNEYILTALRHRGGADFSVIEQRFGIAYVEHLQRLLPKFNNGEHYLKTDNGIALPESAWLISDFIIRELFIEK